MYKFSKKSKLIQIDMIRNLQKHQSILNKTRFDEDLTLRSKFLKNAIKIQRKLCFKLYCAFNKNLSFLVFEANVKRFEPFFEDRY